MKFKYETRNAAGQVCCAGNTPNFYRCPACKPQSVTAAAPITATARRPVVRVTAPVENFTPPNPYSKGLDALRVDIVTDRDRAEITRAADPRPANDYTPPDPYRAGLALLRMQEKENR